MENYSTLSLGEKIYEIRKAKGLSQENMAQALNANRMTVSRMERGETECSAHNLAIIRKFLDIEKAPLLEHELVLYRNRLRVWIDFITKGRFADARVMNEEMSVILDLPFEHDLYLLYRLAEASFLCLEYNVQASAEKLSIAEDLLDNASHEALNLYHRNKGFICGYAGDFINSIKHSTKAVEHAEADKKNDTFALNNIGFAYMFLDKPYLAIIHFERSKALHQLKEDITSTTSGVIDGALCNCYLDVGANRKAEELLKPTIAYRKSVNDNLGIGASLLCMAIIKRRMKLYDECINLCDQALTYSYGHAYANILITKAHCMFEMKKYDECREIITYGRAMLRESESTAVKYFMDSDNITLSFNAIEHLMTLDNNDSIDYIQNTVIPHFRAGGNKFIAKEYCNILEAHYTKKRAKTKANAIAAISRDILLEIYEGEVEFD
ncbi:MAG: helix-turn-helix domain-containing protein [Defluviitaleaceae bacterium]|nr:helix-turn-helix domain-containing protein [Defluviitaleaceae bacterium]